MAERFVKVDAFGKQATYGVKRWAGKVGSRWGRIVTLGSGEMDGVDKAYYASGREIPEFDESGARNWKFHSSDPGVETNPPELIPLPNFKPKGETWVEELLPLDLSEGDDEPQPTLWFIRGLKVHNYTLDGSGNLVQGAKGFYYDNARVNLFIATQRMGIPLSRLHGQSWIDFIARCTGTIAYNAGTGLQGQYYDGLAFNTLKLTRDDAYIDFTWNDISPAPSVPASDFSVRWAGKVKPRYTQTYTFYARYDDGAKVTVNGSVLINDFVAGSERETSGTIALTANVEYDIIVEYKQTYGAGRMALYWSSSSQAKEIVPQERLSPPARTVERYSAHVAFPQTIPAIVAFESVMRRAPGCDWQDVNGAIKILTTPNRAVTHKFIYDLGQATPTNIVDGSFSLRPRAIEDQPDFMTLSYYDVDDPFYKERIVEIDRRADTTKPPKNPIGTIPVGVAHTSLVQRIGETEMNILRNLSLFAPLTGFADSHKVAKGDVVETSHEVAGWNESAPPKFMVTEERFTPKNTADDRAFVLRLHADDYYSDTAHGDIQVRIVSDLVSPYARPPLVSNVVLVKDDRYLLDETHIPLIIGEVTFARFDHPQRGRVWWRRPGNTFTADAALNTLNLTAHGYANGAEVQVASSGTLPGGLSANTTYFVVNTATNTFKLSATLGGTAIDLTSAGTGTHDVYQESDFVATNQVVIPNESLTGTFEVENVPLGINVFKVVSESLKGVSRGLSDAFAYSIAVEALPAPSNVAGFVIDFASRGGRRMQWGQVTGRHLKEYLIRRKDGAGAYYEVARVTGTTWTDFKLVSNATTKYDIVAVMRGGAVSPVPTEVTFDISFYGTTAPTIAAAGSKGAIKVTVTPSAGMNDSGLVSVAKTIVRMYVTTNPPFPGTPTTSIHSTVIVDGLTDTVIVPDPGIATYDSAGNIIFYDLTWEIKALYGFAASPAVFPDGMLGNESAGILAPSPLIAHADLPIATTTEQGALVKAAHNSTAAGTAVQADDPRLAAIANKQPLNSNLTAIAGLTPTNDDILQRKAGAWVNRSPAQFKTDLALVKGDVGLSNVTNDAQLKVASNLSDVANAATSRTNLGLGTSSTPTFGGATINGNMTVVAPVSPQVVVKADNTYSQFHLVAGEFKNYVTFYKDATPTRATSIGMSNPGVNAMKDDILLCAYNGVGWFQRMRIGNDGVINIYDATAPISSIADGVGFWSESIGGSSEFRVRDEAGNVTTVSPHAKDAPVWMYDWDEDKQPPHIARTANVFSAMITFENRTRDARLSQKQRLGEAMPTARLKLITYHTETFDEYNFRMQLAAGDPGYLVAEDWGANQEKLYQDREAERAAHAEAGKARAAQVAENKRRRDALAKWDKLSDEEKGKTERPAEPDADPEPLQPIPPKYKKKVVPAWLATIKRKAGQ